MGRRQRPGCCVTGTSSSPSCSPKGPGVSKLPGSGVWLSHCPLRLAQMASPWMSSWPPLPQTPLSPDIPQKYCITYLNPYLNHLAPGFNSFKPRL